MKAFIFPGQGTQSIGMGKEIYDSFPIAKAILKKLMKALVIK